MMEFVSYYKGFEIYFEPESLLYLAYPVPAQVNEFARLSLGESSLLDLMAAIDEIH
jgi:hypothetical protein